MQLQVSEHQRRNLELEPLILYVMLLLLRFLTCATNLFLYNVYSFVTIVKVNSIEIILFTFCTEISVSRKQNIYSVNNELHINIQQE